MRCDVKRCEERFVGFSFFFFLFISFFDFGLWILDFGFFWCLVVYSFASDMSWLWVGFVYLRFKI